MRSDRNSWKVLVPTIVFWIGAIGDGLIAVEWFLISLDIVNFPIIPSFFVGEGQDFRFAMGVGGLFMMGWTVILFWGSRDPLERKGLLMITAVMLLVAILSEWLVFGDLLTARQLMLGTLVKAYLVVQFAFAYFVAKSA